MATRSSKTTITADELARLQQILDEGKRISDRQDVLLAEAMRLTGETEQAGFTWDAVLINQPFTAERLCDVLGLAIGKRVSDGA